MVEEHDPKRKSGGWVVVALLLLVAYPASLVPIGWCADTGRLPESSVPALKVFYAPVIWAWHNVPVFKQVMDPYSAWFYEDVLGFPV